MARFFDSHCHLQGHDQLEEKLSVWGSDLYGLVNVGTDLSDSYVGQKIASQFKDRNNVPLIYYSVGLHPHYAERKADELVAAFNESFCSDPLLVAIGECGLDYHYDNSTRASQKDAFLLQADLAAKNDLTLIVHAREAFEDLFQLLDIVCPDRVVIHCFTGNDAEALECVSRGYYVSFSGIVTFKNSFDLLQRTSLVPKNRLLIETDSPFLSPHPYRGQKNEPSRVVLTAIKIANHLGVELEEFATMVNQNTIEAFELPNFLK